MGWMAGVRFPAEARFFSSQLCPDRPWDLPSPLSNAYRGIKRPRREADHSLPSSTVANKGGAIPPLSSWRGAQFSTGTTLPFTLSLYWLSYPQRKWKYRKNKQASQNAQFRSSEQPVPQVSWPSQRKHFRITNSSLSLSLCPTKPKVVPLSVGKEVTEPISISSLQNRLTIFDL
jgi:hypothetical protein